MAKTNYTVDNGQKIIFADVAKLNKKELAAVKNYLALGYEIVEPEKKDLSKEEVEAKKAKAAAERAKNPYSSINVEAFLKQKGNEALWEEYTKRYNEQAGTNRTKKNDKGEIEEIKDEPKFLKSGKPKKKGFANCIGWFRSKYAYDEETKTYKPVE